VRGALSDALAALRARRRRTALTAAGIVLATAMLATAAVVAFGLSTGFDRSARAAGLPDLIARFASQSPASVAARVRALPDVAAFSLRREVTGVPLAAGDRSSGSGVAELMRAGRPGYALLAGRAPSSLPGEVAVEQGVARSWHLRVGSTLLVGGLGPQRVVGIAEAPDNVAFPLAAPRIYLSQSALRRRFGTQVDPRVNLVEVWLRDRSMLDAVLVQARATSYGLRGLRFVTRDGLRVLLDQAAGVVIALLTALSIVALLTAGLMIAAAARHEVQRRLTGIGVRRALGATRARIVLALGLEALIVAAPAAAVGTFAGAAAATGPSDRLLALLNERAPGAALALPLLGCWALAVLLVLVTSLVPAWRAAGRPPVTLLRGAELARAPARRGRVRAAHGLVALGMRLVAARRARLLATLSVLGASIGFVLLMLGLASELQALRSDPQTLGKRYQLTASLPAESAPQVRAIHGVAAAAPRYEVLGLASYSLGETVDLIAYPSGHQAFEAPPLVSGRRLRGDAQAEVGAGLADVLGLRTGSILSVQLPSAGMELRLRVAGVVDALTHDGRVAYVPAAALLAADPQAAATEQLAVRLDFGASEAAVMRRLAALGGGPARATGVTARGGSLVDALASILRAVAVVDGLVCLYTLVQALSLVAAERRATVSVLRACGAGTRAVRRLLAGAALAVAVPAALAGIALERVVLGPLTSQLAASYADLPLGAGAGELAIVLGGLLAIGTAAVLWVARRTGREPVLAGLER
jgi:ABC-type antimicrobial peptide transport system permease subunit